VNTGFWSHAICALAFGGLTITAVIGRPTNTVRIVLALAAAATSAWSAAEAASAIELVSAKLADWVEIARTGGLIAFAIYLVPRSTAERGLRPVLELSLGLLVAAWIASCWSPTWLAEFGVSEFLPRLSIAVFGLVCLENLVRNTAPEKRWSIRFASIGLALIFIYDLVLYLAASLFGMLEPALVSARGLVDAFAVPLIVLSATRSRDWVINVHVSRRVVFHSATALIAGIVILIAAVGGYYVRLTGETLGSFLQVVASVLLLLGFVVVMTSGTARSRLRNFVDRNFFSYRYDYRVEWQRFIATMAAGDVGSNLRVRVVKAIADIVDSPGGVLWLADERLGVLAAGADWNASRPMPAFPLGHGELDARLAAGEPFPARDLVAFLPPANAESAGALDVLWLVVPLAHRSVTGFVALQHPRAPRALGWEDHELLKTVGQQVASYLAEDAALRQLVEARQLEDFNRRFAFVVHDLKNMTSQLQLLVRNADKHRDNPEFQRDLIATLRNTVEKMTKMLEQLSARRIVEGGATPRQAVDIAELVREIGARWPAELVGVEASPGPALAIDREKLSAALSHVIQNGVEASEGRTPVAVRVGWSGERAVIEVVDRGKGMDESFIQDELFTPFRSTKQAGYGIGAFQARENMREIGGSLSVASRVGEGTTVTISLPLNRPSQTTTDRSSV
jgi:putative PEP-CTERM system histidine kinase